MSFSVQIPSFVIFVKIVLKLIHLFSSILCRLSGLSPFMGDDDNETIQNVSNAEWDFEDEAFDVVSDMSKKFIEELLIRDPG